MDFAKQKYTAAHDTIVVRLLPLDIHGLLTCPYHAVTGK